MLRGQRNLKADIAELEMIIFGVGSFCFGAEVSHLVSVIRREAADKAGGVYKSSSLTFDDSVSLVDLSAQLGTGDGRGEDRGYFILMVNTSAGVKAARVDSVRGVIKMPLENIEPLPGFLKKRIQTDCIWGIGKLEQDLVILLDLDRYLLRLPSQSTRS